MSSYLQGTTGRAGQAVIESCVVMGLLCLLLMGLFQLARLYVAEDILNYAAARGVRCRSVGLNDFMLYKTIRVGAIPNAGRMTYPVVEGGPPAQRSVERPLIPLYLETLYSDRLSAILDYEEWDSLHYSMVEQGDPPMVHCWVSQSYPIRSVVFRAFYAQDSLRLSGEATMENHYPLYLDVQ